MALAALSSMGHLTENRGTAESCAVGFHRTNVRSVLTNMPASSVTVRNNARERRLEIQLGDQVAFAEYLLGPHTITFTHTRVPEALRGKGTGTQLIKAGLSLARERNLKVIPQCPFFAAYIRAHPEIGELGVLGAIKPGK
jgi:predicted GNAT family acetyltransferase